MTTFHKQLHICDPYVGLEFLKEIQIHYDMNLEPKMFVEKLQMLVLTCVSIDHKFLKLQQWNQS